MGAILSAFFYAQEGIWHKRTKAIRRIHTAARRGRTQMGHQGSRVSIRIMAHRGRTSQRSQRSPRRASPHIPSIRLCHQRQRWTHGHESAAVGGAAEGIIFSTLEWEFGELCPAIAEDAV